MEAQLINERSFWKQLNGSVIVSEHQASQFQVTPPSLSLNNDDFLLQSSSRLLLNTLNWIKSSNGAFKLFE